MLEIERPSVSPDWCYFCGRREDALVAVRYPENAEHTNDSKKYVRICACCVGLLLAVLGGAPAVRMDTPVRERHE